MNIQKLVRSTCVGLVFRSIRGKKRFPVFAVSIGMGCLLTLSAPRASGQSDPAGPNVKKFSLRSRILKEERSYLVWVPNSYQPSMRRPRHYPVLYLLDGDSHLPWASAVVEFMGGNRQIPELIIVAIPSTDRARDLTPTRSLQDFNGNTSSAYANSGGGENFLRFLKEELMPRVEADYRTAPYRIFVGHSLAGVLAMHTFLQRPAPFQAYIAMDPSTYWDDQLLLRRAKEILPFTDEIREPIYMSIAGRPKDHPDHARADARALAAYMQTNISPKSRFKSEYFESEDHGSVPLMSLYHGLLFVFDGYKFSAGPGTEPSTIREHFTKLEERFHFGMQPPDELLVSDWREHNWPEERRREEERIKSRQSINETSDAVTIDLKPYLNNALTNGLGDSANNLAQLPSGIHVFAGVPFDVQGSIQLKGGGMMESFPVAVEKIRINRRWRKLYLLHGATDVTMEHYGQRIAKLVLIYADGSTRELTIRAGGQVANWWFPLYSTGMNPAYSYLAPGSERAWAGSNPYMEKWAADWSLVLYRTAFDNPQPDVPVTVLNYVSAESTACPFMVGLTVE
jgi:predicted alpha/beta superfamily hydrolase